MKFPSAGAFLRDMFSRNAYYKLFSGLLVALLYVWVLGDGDTEIAMVAPIRVATPENTILVNQPPTQVQITVSGRWNILQRFGQEGEIPPIVLRPDLNSGDTMMRIEKRMVNLPSGLQVANIQPTFVRAELRPRQTKRVPLRVRTLGQPAAGHTLGDIELTPNTIEISGPREEIRRTRFITTEPIDVTQRTETFSEQVQLRYDSPHIRDTLTQPVQATIPINTIESDRRFEGLPVLAVNTSLRAIIRPKTVDVTLRGPRELVKALKKEDILASVDLADIDEAGLYQKQVRIRNLPRGVTLSRHFPTDFQVEVSPPAPIP